MATKCEEEENEEQLLLVRRKRRRRQGEGGAPASEEQEEEKKEEYGLQIRKRSGDGGSPATKKGVKMRRSGRRKEDEVLAEMRCAPQESEVLRRHLGGSSPWWWLVIETDFQRFFPAPAEPRQRQFFISVCVAAEAAPRLSLTVSPSCGRAS